jgi:hypothetical protein
VQPESPYHAPKAALTQPGEGSSGFRMVAVVAGVFTTGSGLAMAIVISQVFAAGIVQRGALLGCACLAGGLVAARLARPSALLNAASAGAISAGLVVAILFSGIPAELVLPGKTPEFVARVAAIALFMTALSALGGWIARRRARSILE